MPQEYRDEVKEEEQIENTRYSVSGGFDSFLPGTHTIKEPTGSNVVIARQTLTISDVNNIQSALDGLGREGGGVLSLKSGTYFPTADIIVPTNTILQGEGIANTILDFADGNFQVSFKGTARTVGGTGVSITEGSTTVTGVGGTTFLTDVATDDIILIRVIGSGAYSEVSSVTNNTTLLLKEAWPYPTITNLQVSIFRAISNSAIKNLTITNSSRTGVVQGALTINRAVNFVAENVLVISNNAQNGVSITTVVNSEFRNVESSYNINSGFYMDSLKKVMFYNCSALGNSVAGFEIDTGEVSEGNVFYSCFAEGNTDHGFTLNGSCNLFSCRSMGNDGAGYQANGNFIMLISCISVDNGTDGIEMDTGADITLQNCFLKNNDAYGIDITVNASRVFILQCLFSGNTSGTVRDAGTNTYYSNVGTGIFTAANGANNNIDIGEQRFTRISGPGAAFSISGITNTANAKMVTLQNTVAFDMTITNQATSDDTRQILTLTGADIVLTGVSLANFVYDSTSKKWILLGTQG